MRQPENTHLKGKYHCMADLLFDGFGFDQTSKTVLNATDAFTQNKQVSHTVIFPLKKAFSGVSI